MICIIGAGISGLTTGYFLQKAGLEYCIVEASDRHGGYIQTFTDGEYLLEQGPNSFLMNDNILEFIKEIGLESEIEYAKPVNKNRFIYKNGRYQALPSNPLSLATSRFFSWKTKTKILKELLRLPNPQSLEKGINVSLYDFFVKKFGAEVADYALQPFIAGIYSGDPKKLLTHLTFPALLEYEEKHGSIIKGLIKNTGARKKSITFKKGMKALPNKIAQGLNIKYSTTVRNIERSDRQYVISTNQGNIVAEKFVITTEASSTSSYLKGLFPDIASALDSLYYPPTYAVHTVYKKQQVSNMLQGFGGLNPVKEKLFTAGSIFSSTIFEGRCPEDEILFTTFVGGSLFKEVVNLSDDEIFNQVHDELSSNFSITGIPLMQKISKWNKSIPQYDVNLERVMNILSSQTFDNVFICANWYKGVSIGDCIEKGIATAKNIIDKVPN